MPLNKKFTIVDLMRHGEPLGGALFRGSQDDPLSERGWSQARAAIAPIEPWQTIITSPMKRCNAFAEELSQQRALPLAVHPDLREIHFGLWEGMTAEAVNQQWPGLLNKIWHDTYNNTPPEGEPLHDFNLRVLSTWHRILAELEETHTLVCAHGGTIRVILCDLLGMPLKNLWRIEMGFAARTRIGVRHFADGQLQCTLISHTESPADD